MEKIWMKNWPAGIPDEVHYPYGPKPIFEYLRAHAKSYPQKVAINFYGLEIRYGELDLMTDRLAAYLHPARSEKGRSRRPFHAQLPPIYHFPNRRP